MNHFVLCVLLGLAAAASAQWNNQNQNQYPQFPNQQQFPQQFPQFPDMNKLCSQPGSNCKTESRFAEESSSTDDKGKTTKFTRVCDDRGCYDRKSSNGASVSSASFAVMTICAVVVGAKIYFH